MSYVSTYQAHLLEGLSSGQKSVITALATFERAGKCWPSVATLAKRASMGVRTVQRHLAALINLGYITRTYRAGHAAVTRLFIGQTPAKLAPPPLPNWHPEPGISESVNQIPAAPPATPEPGTETANADAIVVFTENKHPIAQAVTEEMLDVLAIDCVVSVPEITGYCQQVEVPVKAFTEALEPAKEVPPACTPADTDQAVVAHAVEAVQCKAEVPAQAIEAATDTDQAVVAHAVAATDTDQAAPAEPDPLAEVPEDVMTQWAEVRRMKKKAPRPNRLEISVLVNEARLANLTMVELIEGLTLRNWTHYNHQWGSIKPTPPAPPAPKVWQPDPNHTPASPSTIAKMKEHIAAMKARWNETPPPLPKGRGLA